MAASSVASVANAADIVLISRSRKTFSRTCCVIVLSSSTGRFGSTFETIVFTDLRNWPGSIAVRT